MLHSQIVIAATLPNGSVLGGKSGRAESIRSGGHLLASTMHVYARRISSCSARNRTAWIRKDASVVSLPGRGEPLRGERLPGIDGFAEHIRFRFFE